MASKQTHTEDWNQSMEKCKAISKLIPMLADSIHQIRGLDHVFERNKELQRAEQMFGPLNTVQRIDNIEEKMIYVDEYRDRLIQGIEQLTRFFNGLKNELELIDEGKQGEFGRLSANIFMTQESIISIATH